MRFKVKPKPKIGDYRTVRKFCLLPRSDGKTIYWLEFVNVVQRLDAYYYAGYEQRRYWSTVKIEAIND